MTMYVVTKPWLTIVITFIVFNLTVNCDDCLERFIQTLLGDKSIVLLYKHNYLDVFNKLNHQPKILINLNKPKISVSQFYGFTETEFHYVIIAKDLSQFRDLLVNVFRNRQWNFKTKHLIIFKNDNIDGGIIKDVFRTMWNDGVYNSVVITLYTLQGFTWYPFAPDSNCGSIIHLKRFNVCSNFNPFINKSIPKKLQGCLIKIGWDHSNKLLLNDPSESKDPGMLIQLMSVIERKLKISLICKYVPDLDNSLKNQTALVYMVHDKKIDIFLNDILADVVPEEVSDLDRSIPLFTSRRVWVLPERTPRPVWFIYANTSSLIMWTIFLTIYLMLVALWYTSSYSTVPINFMIITRLLLWQDNWHARSISQKIIVASGTLFALHYSLLFTSRLISAVTNPPLSKAITTLDDLMNMQVEFRYGIAESKVIQNTNLKLWNHLEEKRRAVINNLKPGDIQNFLESNLKDTHLVFSIDIMLCYIYIDNFEEVDIHPIPVNSLCI